MTTNIHRETAKIYQFPIRPRRRLENGATVPQDLEIVVSVVDTCWYHDEAVKDAAPKNGERPKPC